MTPDRRYFCARVALVNIALAATLALAACSGSFRIVPSLGPDGRVVFGFYNPESELTGIDVCHISVDERTGDRRVVVWEAQRDCGDGVEISKVAYGSGNGWRASVPAQPLATHHRYVVLADGGGLHGQAEFVLGDGGTIGIIPPR